MRVVVVTTSFPRDDDDPAGHFVLASARRLAQGGDDVHVLAPGDAAPIDHAAGLTVHRVGGARLFAWPGAAPRARENPLRLVYAATFAVGVRRALARLGRVDRAVAHWLVPCAFPLLAGTTAPLEAVAHGADVRLLLATPPLARRQILRDLLGRRPQIAFAARALLDRLAVGIGPELATSLRRLSVVRPPDIDVPNVAARAAALRGGVGLAPGESLVVAAGRFVPSKRFELAIDAALRARAIRLVMVGDGPERASLEARAKGTAAISFAGALPRREALAWIAAADALVHPSAVESAPTVVREARALGVRVVACDAGDVAAWAKADAGITLAPPDAAEIASALNGSRDPSSDSSARD
jgi:glycosyltransferase involved in cell wall biosynthesis